MIPHRSFQIEIASSRSEIYEKGSRSPSKVEFASLEEDLKRRDFTINAMAMDIHPDHFGKVYDPFKGCLLYTSPSPRDRQKSRMPSSA